MIKRPGFKEESRADKRHRATIVMNDDVQFVDAFSSFDIERKSTTKAAGEHQNGVSRGDGANLVTEGGEEAQKLEQKADEDVVVPEESGIFRIDHSRPKRTDIVSSLNPNDNK